MAYASVNFKTKKELKEAVKAGKGIYIFSPGGWPTPKDGAATVEGPYYPKPHTWYAQVTLKDGLIVSVK